METRIQRTKSHAFLVDCNALSRINALLHEHYPTVGYEASCSDGTVLKSETIGEILSFENPSFRRIQKLSISFHGESYTNSGNISFGESYSTTASLNVRGSNDAQVLRLANELESRLADLKPWYSWLTKIPPLVLVPIILVILTTISVWHRVIVTKTLDTRSLPIFDIVYLAVPFLAIYVVAIIYADRAWQWLFPKIWFLVGRQELEMQRRQRVRSWIFGGVIMALVIGIIGNYISAALFSK